jgi:hypothetical protein
MRSKVSLPALLAVPDTSSYTEGIDKREFSRNLAITLLLASGGYRDWQLTLV